MVEVLIAGIILSSALIAVSRFSVSALSNSAKLAERSRIEAAINNNIQTLQKEDSYFSADWIKKNGSASSIEKNEESLNSACSNPTQSLKDHLESVVDEPDIEGITRTFDTTSSPGILTVIYSFDAPEQSIEQEIRVIEINPNFSAECYQTR